MALAGSNLQKLDLNDAIRHEKSPLFIDNAHFVDRGHSIIGKYIAGHLLETNSKLKRVLRDQS